MGDEAYKFVDFLKKAGQSYWQVLPVLTTGYGDSPYQSFSTYAGNPYLIDLDFLCRDGLLREEEYRDSDFGDDPGHVDFGKLFVGRPPLLRKAYERGIERDRDAFREFCEKSSYWIDDYALYMALKVYFKHKSYHEWPVDIRSRRPEAIVKYGKLLAADVEYHQYIQFLFYRQWMDLKKYANKNGVQIIGDIPIYVADDGADTWSHPELFWLDGDCVPVKVAGCPPDAFTADGQLWGNPLYRWDYHKKTGFDWWHRRIFAALDMYDMVRIDHFRGFESFWAVDYGEATACDGEWLKGPGIEPFLGIQNRTKGRIIAEDLGYMDDNVRKLLKDSGFPGMKVMLFGFNAGGDSDDVPYKHFGNCVSYVGTHDNETFMGWLQSASHADTRLARRYMNLSAREGFHWGAIRTLLGTGSDLAVMTMQDILGLDNAARMNTPSTLGGNWTWRLPAGYASPKISSKLRMLTKTYSRLPSARARRAAARKK